MKRTGPRFVSHGHGERFEAVVWVNDTAQPAWNGEGDFPDDSALLEEAIGHGPAGDRPEGLLVMVKHEAAWSFAAVSPQGDWADSSRLGSCAECHREAPRDFVFRVR